MGAWIRHLGVFAKLLICAIEPISHVYQWRKKDVLHRLVFSVIKYRGRDAELLKGGLRKKQKPKKN
jgi:hypothetical protein